MNTLTIASMPPSIPIFEVGDFFKRVSDVGPYAGRTELYILCRVGYEKYSLVSLMSGERWRDTSANIDEVVKGLEYFGRDAKITIEF